SARVIEKWGRDERGRAFSREALFVPGVALPADSERVLRELDRLYYRWIPRLTADLVSIVKREGGGQSAIVLEKGPVGLVLGPPRIEGLRIERKILSGWLVAKESGA